MGLLTKLCTWCTWLLWPFDARQPKTVSTLTTETKKKLNDLDQQVSELTQRIESLNLLQRRATRFLLWAYFSVGTLCVIPLWSDIFYLFEVIESDHLFSVSSSIRLPKRSFFSIFLLLPVDSIIFRNLSISAPKKEASILLIIAEWIVFCSISSLTAYASYSVINSFLQKKISKLQEKVSDVKEKQSSIVSKMMENSDLVNVLDVIGKYQNDLPQLAEASLKASKALNAKDPEALPIQTLSSKSTPTKSSKGVQYSQLVSPFSQGILVPKGELQPAALLSMPSFMISYKRSWIDRIIDLLLGEGEYKDSEFYSENGMPSTIHTGCFPTCLPVYALICRFCHSHNGMVPYTRMKSLIYKCPLCGVENNESPLEIRTIEEHETPIVLQNTQREPILEIPDHKIAEEKSPSVKKTIRKSIDSDCKVVKKKVAKNKL